MLGDIFEKSERKDIAGVYYAQIVRNYPLSKRTADAKGKLKSYGVPIPQPDPKAVAWMTAEQNAPRPRENLMHKSIGIFHSGPDVHMAAVSGTPQMEPESSTMPGTDILSGRATGSGAGKSGIVATVVPGEAAPSGTPAASAATEDVNTAPASDPTNGAAPTTDPPAATTPDAGAPATGDGSSANPPATDAATDGTAPATDPAATDSAKPASTTPAADSKNQKESSSKKKGLRKLIPW
jgi:hypothetical protein